MTAENRPSPEELLGAIEREEKERGKGRLKIFLGMAAGVGKTYTMLEEARLLKREGVDVVVGIVDTHGRQETAALLEGLKIIPPKSIRYKDREFEELDIDEIIRIHPAVVLVDELAHSNVPGARHNKRWEDVVEILENGIDVYTTLNVQHIESLNDVVEGITGISVRETVPDIIVEAATFIQLVDLTPDELLQRLKEGKVYFGDQSRVAASNFFQKDRLTALREIVLRFTAKKVDHDLHGMVPASDRPNGWRAREKLLVAVSPSPHSQKLIRTTRRIAFHLDAYWIAVYINDGRILNESENNQLAKNLSLARDLGADVITTSDPNVADGIQRIARQRGVTQIILGRPPKNRFFDFFRKSSLLEKLAMECSDIDLHVIRQEKQVTSYRRKLMAFSGRTSYTSYLCVVLLTFAISCLGWLLLPYIGDKLVGIIFFITILSISLFFKKGPIFLTTALFTAIFILFFVPPNSINALPPYDDDSNLALIIFILPAIVIGIMVDRIRKYKELLVSREESAQALYEILRQIISAPSREEMFQSLKERLGKIVKGSFEIVVKSPDDGLELDEMNPLINSEKEKSVAIWAFENNKEAGWSTTTLPMAKNLYVPLKGFQEVVGVLVYHPAHNRVLTTEQRNFLYTISQQLANYLERTFAEDKARRAEHLKHVEKIYHTVLKSISHELQHPLASMQEAIFEAFQAFKYDQAATPKKGVIPQFHKIEQTSSGLLSLLDNVSVMAKLSGGLIPIQKDWIRIEDVVKYCCEKMEPFFKGRVLVIKTQENLPPLFIDHALIEVMLHHLMSNAIKYSPPDSTIDVEVRRADNNVICSISDEGKGIPQDMINAVFDEFYRVPGTKGPGMGLGLSIAKKIAEKHGGFLTCENIPGKGAKFSLYLPISEEVLDSEQN